MIIRVDLYFIVPTKPIQKGKEIFLYKKIKNLINKRQGKMILSSGFVVDFHPVQKLPAYKF